MKRIFVALFVFLILAGDVYARKKVLMIIAHNNFRDEELFHTKGTLEMCGAVVDVVSNKRGIAKGMLGGTFNVDKTYYDVDWDKYKAIVVIGGSGATVFWRDNFLIDKVKYAYKRGKILGAICISPVLFAEAGILKGKKATCWAGVRNRLSSGRAIYTGQDVVVSGRIVTASGPWAASNFARAICRLLGYR